MKDTNTTTAESNRATIVPEVLMPPQDGNERTVWLLDRQADLWVLFTVAAILLWQPKGALMSGIVGALAYAVAHAAERDLLADPTPDAGGGA